MSPELLGALALRLLLLHLGEIILLACDLLFLKLRQRLSRSTGLGEMSNLATFHTSLGRAHDTCMSRLLAPETSALGCFLGLDVVAVMGHVRKVTTLSAHAGLIQAIGAS